MTIETRTTLELKDIRAIEFECNTCHTKTVYPIAKYGNPPTHCSHCTEGRQWIVTGSEEWEELSKLGKTIQGASKSAGFTLRLEIAPIPPKP
jgi:DNA replicative helicase MCM subunit Mcm2 (Cdc46/Mcm family)